MVKNYGKKGNRKEQQAPHPPAPLFHFRLAPPQVFLKLIIKNHFGQKKQCDPHIHKPDIHDNGKCQSGRYCFIDHIIQPVINASSIVIPVAGKHIDMQNDGEEGQRRPCCH